MQESKACPEHRVNFCCGRKEQNEVNRLLFLSPRFLSFIVFAICEPPQGYASAAFSAQHRGKQSGCHFCELAVLERRREGAGGDATSRQGEGLGWGGWGAWRGAGCRDRPRLGRCASVSLHICGRMNHPTDVGSQGRAVTPATQRCAGAGRSGGARLQQGSEGAALTFDTHKTTLTSCTYCHFRRDPKMYPLTLHHFVSQWEGGVFYS